MKKVIIIFSILIYSLICSFDMFAQYPMIKWSFDLHDASFGQSAAADLDGDGKLEICFSTYRNDSSVYALNAEDGSLLWKYNSGGCNDAAPLIYDINGDKMPEVIVACSCVPKTVCLSGKEGKIIWQTPTRGSDSPPTIADIYGDGNLEILHGEFGGYVICFNAEDGKVKWEIEVDKNSWVQTAPTIVDLDGDGALDFVVATWGFDRTNSKIYAYRGSDHKLIWTSSVPQSYIYHGTAVADIDGDGKPELVIGSYDGILYALNGEDGSLLWKYQYSTATYYYIGAPAAIADLNRDGLYEVFFSNLNVVGVLSNEGKLIWKYENDNYSGSFRGVAISDINGDDTLDLAYGTSEGKLVVLSGSDGKLLWKLNLSDNYGKLLELDHAPLIADFDNDNNLDVFIVGGHTDTSIVNNYGRAYMVSAGRGKGPAWLMFQRDVRRTSFVSNDWINSVPAYGRKLHEGELRLFISQNVLSIEFETDEHEFSYEIYDYMGRMLLKGCCMDSHIDISSLMQGVYIIRVFDKKKILSDKFLVLK